MSSKQKPLPCRDCGSYPEPLMMSKGSASYWVLKCPLSGMEKPETEGSKLVCDNTQGVQSSSLKTAVVVWNRLQSNDGGTFALGASDGSRIDSDSEGYLPPTEGEKSDSRYPSGRLSAIETKVDEILETVRRMWMGRRR